ncbi:uncharacterized protein LOC127700793 [Mytilus californianus]|uniref:uncharacterized protein LOC127700793 n=1 Tax=Mytilus californianus TaxID=6549 RepID=UPI002247C465|nr:uncharacterized protein LOC127700793 [Mytilus californianus]
MLGMAICQICVCLTWKLHKNSLILNCKIPKIEFPVHFYDPAGTDFAYCVHPKPESDCMAFFKNTSISQNVTSAETILTVKGRIYPRVNGIWTCTHGSGEKGSAEITVPDLSVTETDIEKKIDIKWCWAVAVCWTFLGCLISYVFRNLFLKVLVPLLRKCAGESCLANLGRTLSKSITTMIERITNVCPVLSKEPENRVKVFRRLILILLLSLMVSIPLVAGLVKEGKCTGHLSFLPFGAVFGLIISIFCIENKVQCKEKNILQTELEDFTICGNEEVNETILLGKNI